MKNEFSNIITQKFILFKLFKLNTKITFNKDLVYIDPVYLLKIKL